MSKIKVSRNLRTATIEGDISSSYHILRVNCQPLSDTELSYDPELATQENRDLIKGGEFRYEALIVFKEDLSKFKDCEFGLFYRKDKWRGGNLRIGKNAIAPHDEDSKIECKLIGKHRVLISFVSAIPVIAEDVAIRIRNPKAVHNGVGRNTPFECPVKLCAYKKEQRETRYGDVVEVSSIKERLGSLTMRSSKIIIDEISEESSIYKSYDPVISEI